MPSIDRIARTINGPNEVQHLSAEKIEVLQDVRWGQLKAQDQLALLRTARFVKALYGDPDDEVQSPAPAPGNGAPVSAGVPDRVAIGEGTPTPPPARLLGVDGRSVHHLLQLFRAFVTGNATVWKMGSNHHHPIWQDIAVELDAQDLNYDASEGPDWAFVQPENRKSYAQLVWEFGEQQDEREATERGG